MKEKDFYFLQVGLTFKRHEYFCSRDVAMRWFNYYAKKHPTFYLELTNNLGETIALQD